MRKDLPEPWKCQINPFLILPSFTLSTITFALRNVAEATTLPKREKSQARALTMAEQALFLDVINTDRLAPAFLLLLTTGLRRGELLGLRWRNINLTNKVLSVEENLVITREHTTLYQPPKTERSKGQIPLNELAVETLKTHRKKMLSEGNCSPESPVFCTEKGTPIHPRNFNRKFTLLRNAAGISDEVTVHSLRHTFATRLLEIGVSMREAQELLRHETLPQQQTSTLMSQQT